MSGKKMTPKDIRQNTHKQQRHTHQLLPSSIPLSVCLSDSLSLQSLGIPHIPTPCIPPNSHSQTIF